MVIMKNYKILTLVSLIIFVSLTSIGYTHHFSLTKETLKFDSSTYNGETKNGKADGVGILIFSDGSKYEGEISKNRIHGKGKYIDAQGKVYQGKFIYGKITKTIKDREACTMMCASNNREVVKLNVLTGTSNYFERRGVGNTANQWFESKPTIINVKEIEPIKEIDIFDAPSIFSSDYGDEKKIKEILDLKNTAISIANAKTAINTKNQKIIYKYTSKGEKDLNVAKASAQNRGNSPSHESSTSTTTQAASMEQAGGC